MLKIGWMSSATGPGSRALLKFVHDSIVNGSLDASIEYVFSSRENGEDIEIDKFAEMVSEFKLPFHSFSFNKFRTKTLRGLNRETIRIRYDTEVIDKIKNYNVDLIIMAGYMLIASEEFTKKFPIINLHPALPNGPKGTWQQVVNQIIESHQTQTGTMIHLVTNDLDRGPVISCCRCDLESEWNNYLIHKSRPQLFKEIRKKQYLQEPGLMLETLKWISTGIIDVENLSYNLENRAYPLPVYMNDLA